MSLHKDIVYRLRAGALVVIVEESDEQLAVAAARVAAKTLEPVLFTSTSDQDVLNKLDAHRTGKGTLVICDFLRAFSTNPIAIRIVREIALQRREQGDKPSRLILLETPGVQVPDGIKGDVEIISAKMPGMPELTEELEDFLKIQDKIKLKGNGEEKAAIASSVSGLGRHEAARLFGRCFVSKETLDPVWLRKEKALRVAERLGGALTFIDTDIPAVGGLENLKEWLATRKKAFSSESARKYGLPEPKGLLLLGPPGVGKSLSAKTVAREWGLPALRLDVGKLFGSLVGQSEAQARNAIESAEACAPCVLWLDEMEKGLAQGGLDGGTSQRVFGTFLTWLQEKTKPVFVVATANNISGVPPELLRKGRFDEIFFVDLPTVRERSEIIGIHLLRHGRRPKDFDIPDLAIAAKDFSGAELEQAVIEAMFNAYAEDHREVTTEDILAAINGTTPLAQTMEEKIKALREWAKGRARFAGKQEAVKETQGLRRPAMQAMGKA